MEHSSEIYIYNLHGEVLKLARIDLLDNKENILLHSSDGGTFFVSKFIFNFLSSLANPDSDSILTPISSKNLAPICQMLNLRTEIHEDITQFTKELELLGLDFRSCKNLVSSINKQHDKPIKRDPEKLEKDNDKKDKVIEDQNPAEPENDTNVLEQLLLDPPENTLAENKTLISSASPDILKEPFALVAIETSGQPEKEDTENIEDENIQDKDVDTRPKERKEIKKPYRKFKYKENPKTTFQSIEGKEELASLECRICGKTFERKEFTQKGHITLLRNYHGHLHLHKLSILKCECDIEFKSTKEKLNHIRLIHKTFVECDQCNETLKNQESLDKHRDKVHRIRQCHICDYVTTARGDYNLKAHYMTRHKVQEDAEKGANKPKLKCGVADCEKIFIRQADLNQHHNRVHISRECPICHKMLKNKVLQQHIDTVHNNLKKYFCEKCGKGFTYPALLEQHEAVEHQGFRYQCRYPDCQYKDREYKDKSNRSAHERIKHGAQYNVACRTQYAKVLAAGGN